MVPLLETNVNVKALSDRGRQNQPDDGRIEGEWMDGWEEEYKTKRGG